MALADAHGCADMGDTDDTGTADARAESGSTAASRVEAERLRWNPTLGDDAVPLVGEWKYPLDKPHGPVMCTSRRVLSAWPILTNAGPSLRGERRTDATSRERRAKRRARKRTG